MARVMLQLLHACCCCTLTQVIKDELEMRGREREKKNMENDDVECFLRRYASALYMYVLYSIFDAERRRKEKKKSSSTSNFLSCLLVVIKWPAGASSQQAS